MICVAIDLFCCSKPSLFVKHVLIGQSFCHLLDIKLSTLVDLLHHGAGKTVRSDGLGPVQVLPELSNLKEKASHINGRCGEFDQIGDGNC